MKGFTYLYLCLWAITFVSTAWADVVRDAATSGDIGDLARLIAGDAKLVNQTDADGSTALHYAVAKERIGATRYLLGNGADVNARKKNGVTTLHIAASCGNVEMARMLVEAGADTEAKDNTGRTPSSIAQSKGQATIVELLKAVQSSHYFTAKAEILTKIQPLQIRGTNYYPSRTPWAGMWNGNTTAETWDDDMARAAILNINTVRTFLIRYDDRSLITDNGTPTQTYLDRFEKFLEIAWKHGVRVIVCFDCWWTQPETLWKNAIRAFVEPHKLDGRILMWEMVNEPDLDRASAFLNGSIPLTRSIDSQHLTTVQLDTTKDRQLNKHGLRQFPDIANYHDYYSYKTLWEKGLDAVTVHIRETIEWNDNKPLFLGEFGCGCVSDGSPGAPNNEDQQAALYGLKLHAIEKENALGAINWALLSWENTGSPSDRTWGSFRQDGTLRPAGELLKQCYARWAHPQIYIYCDECHTAKAWTTLINCRLDDPHPDDSLITHTVTEDGVGLAMCEPFRINDSKMLRFEVVVNNLSKGSIAAAYLQDGKKNIAVIEGISAPGLYSFPVPDGLNTLSGGATLHVTLKLSGATDARVVWDRVAITGTR